MKFLVTEPNGTQTEINGTFHTLSFEETLLELDPFQRCTPCFVNGLQWDRSARVDTGLSTKRDDSFRCYVYNYASASNAVYGPFFDRDAADQAICGKKTWSVAIGISSWMRVRAVEEL
jgi:hypothetical protein